MPMDLSERICRAICIAEEVDPDRDGVGLGVLIPKGQKYKLWEARMRVAEELMKEFNGIHD